MGIEGQKKRRDSDRDGNGDGAALSAQ